MIDRRKFVWALAASVLANPKLVCAQTNGSAHRIGYRSFRAQPGPADKAFIQGLSELGYAEGRNLVFEYR